MKILVTRPEPDASELSERLRAMGHEALLDPLISLTFTDERLRSTVGYVAVIATSRNGLRALKRDASCQALSELPLIAVGPATAELGKSLGFRRIWSGSSGALDVVEIVRDRIDPADGPLLHLAGDQLAVSIKDKLSAKGYRIDAPIVYKMVPSVEFRSQTVVIFEKGAIDGVILLSPRTARIYCELVKFHGLERVAAKTVVFCVSEQVAQAVDINEKTQLRVASNPSLEEVLALVNLEAAHLA